MLQFGVFDHLDSDGRPLDRLFESRLKLIALIEREGFAGYHLAEHHSTPLGMAASPSVFLAAAFARTTRLRLGRSSTFCRCITRSGCTRRSACSTI